MAQFSDLSLELLELIASYLRVNRPGNGAGSTRDILLNHEGGISEVARDLREAQAAFSSFSYVNKICHQLYYEEAWRVVSIHGPDAANQLISLFRILHNNPRISSLVKELVLQFNMHDDTSRISIRNMAFLMGPDIPRIFGGNMSRNEYYSMLDKAHGKLQVPVQNSKYILWATALVFRGLDHLTHLTISVPDHTLTYGQTIMFGAGTIGFPSLQSLTMHDATRDDVDEAPWLWPPPCIWDSVLGNTPSVSDVFLHNFSDFRTFFEQEANGFGKTLASLVLNGVELEYDELLVKLRDFSNLEKFVCRRVAIGFDQTLLGVQILDPTDPDPLMTILSELAATLHTICLPSVHKLPAVLLGRFSFKKFRNLQNFWLDADFSKAPRDEGYGSTEPLQGTILRHLPASLKRLHLEGKPTDEDLSWLASNCKSRLPNLKELGLDATCVDSASMRPLVQQLRDAGVAIVPVDPYPQLW
ncbi:hypothetical protein GCG54_00012765 [Colletotrichum gloeosporioides]|uniref:Uncharacterized protein n=1 Tax=Colletotrichum gloeosporioides TaxID=474922 RepID=A0A8H4CT49_COLGL|nr:uncharacterized protein GCG54_00012765 [Colletotrichum gloeosporioides]KAF3809482.1 hypothetical protein GCG54_00012765 [Colletotrichum gloeosporioides]